MKKNQLFFSLVISIATISTLSAEEIFRPYVGIDVTHAKFDGADPAYEDHTSGSIGGRVGTDIGEYFGAEARGGFGIIDDTVNDGISNVDIDMKHYIAAFGKIQTPVYKGFRAYGLAGVAYLELEASNGNKTDDSDFAWGLGTSYLFNENWGANIEYLSLNSDSDGDVGGINLGVTYHF